MQPQETGGFDWWHGLSGLGGGALGTLLTWFWRAARAEPTIRADFEKRVSAAETLLKTEIAEAERRVETKIDAAEKGGNTQVAEMTEHFHNALLGIRQQINDIAQKSLPRDEFNTFRQESRKDNETTRRENREDFGKLEAKIDQILARHK